MTGGGALLRGIMARHIYVVGRAHRDLYEFLSKQFEDDGNVKVILDRRLAGATARVVPVPAAGDGTNHGPPSDRHRRGA